MASAIQWGALGASTLVASAEFNSLADEGNAAGSLISASQNMYTDWFLSASYTTAPSGHVGLYFVTYFGGSATDGDASVDPPATGLVGNFPLREAVGRQKIPLNFILMPNRDFNPVLINQAGTAMGAGSNFLYFQAYDVNPDA